MNDDIDKFIKMGGTIKAAADQLKAAAPLNIGEALKAQQLQTSISKFGIGSTVDLTSIANPMRDVLATHAYQEELRREQMNRSSQIMADHHRRLADAQHRRDNPVLAVFEELQSYIRDFEGTLRDDEVVGARMVTFGQNTTFHIKRLGYSTPCLIHFDGINEEGNRVRLVQNISQLSVLFVAMRLPEGEEKRPIGFVYPEE